jgi:DNA-binding FadR family transcriptional regulator
MHRLIARIADNPLLLAAFDLVDAVRSAEDWQHKRHMARTTETKALYHTQHTQIIDAIDARDMDAARNAMTEHLQMLRDNLSRSMGDAS